jgi:hypothetical protein
MRRREMRILVLPVWVRLLGTMNLSEWTNLDVVTELGRGPLPGSRMRSSCGRTVKVVMGSRGNLVYVPRTLKEKTVSNVTRPPLNLTRQGHLLLASGPPLFE